MRINVVFNLESVDELKELTRALEGTATLQAKIILEQKIKGLKTSKSALTEEIRQLKAARSKIRDELTHGCDFPDETEKEEPSPASETLSGIDYVYVHLDDDGGEAEPTPEATADSSLVADAERVIERITAQDTEEST